MKYFETSYRMKQRLAGALEEILAEKPFPKITVGDIVDLCGVNRKTFYYHFTDIHALLCWMFHEQFCQLMKTNCDGIDYVALANMLMDHVEQHGAIFCNLVNTVGEDSLKRSLADDMRALQDTVVSSFETIYGVHFEAQFRAFLVGFLADAIVGILMDWIRRRQYRDRENTIEYLSDIIRTTIPGLIDRRLHLDGEK